MISYAQSFEEAMNPIKRLYRRLTRSKTIAPSNPPELRARMSAAVEALAKLGIIQKTILDVGASNGRWSEMAVRSFPEARCILFEPQPVRPLSYGNSRQSIRSSNWMYFADVAGCLPAPAARHR